MKHRIATFMVAVMVAASLGAVAAPGTAAAASASEIDRNSTAALNDLFARQPKAKELAANAKAILIFPGILKAGFMFGGQWGEGALREGGKTVGYYNTVAASYGLQVGGQKFGYVMLLMTDDAVKYLKSSKGWEVGVGPSVVVVDEGIAKTLTTTTAKDDVYAFVFDQKGLMAGLGLQGSKITRIRR